MKFVFIADIRDRCIVLNIHIGSNINFINQYVNSKNVSIENKYL